MREWLLSVLVVVIVSPLIAAEVGQGVPVGEEVGYMGVGFAVDPDTGQVHVEHVVPQAPAFLGGVRAGDILDTVNGVEVRFKSHSDVLEFFARSAGPGVPVRMSYLRNGAKAVRVEVTPTVRPEGVAERNYKAVLCKDGALFASRQPR
ncbi:MAG: PDZ domain-containing protein [Acidobacteria bacterium]|nr:PDZ domain-containing protein [Acidobacteriota bacterium]